MNYDRVAYLGCKWALQYFKGAYTHEVAFDTSELKDPKILDDLKTVMNNLVKSHWTQWNYTIEGNNIIFTQPIPYDERKRCWLKIFDSNWHNNAYAALYDKDGKLAGISCLVVWDKYKCDNWNEGYFDGRVPEHLPQNEI